ncbi:DNA-formamidopyrimidine glycosylase family protein [Rathayibacter rathayi]|uniref:DNA-formamidopyrimidine glycosylase family protein n=1 Tax=Rathayibacter rathayi TaxID=33887 RepID=UPI000BE3E8E5|nr:hypothetical protein C1O28_09605 [Rathayibacter rathayi]PPG64744.1 hypothetical protein C5C16_14215 [Rathayibacter rathayi]PPG77983.1 hypothetical protein C5C15_08385 [Rathayibacter rathayi]
MCTVLEGELRSGDTAGSSLAGLRILGHETHGKHLLARFSGGSTLHTHLRTQGSWTAPAASSSGPCRKTCASASASTTARRSRVSTSPSSSSSPPATSPAPSATSAPTRSARTGTPTRPSGASPGSRTGPSGIMPPASS